MTKEEIEETKLACIAFLNREPIQIGYGEGRWEDIPADERTIAIGVYPFRRKPVPQLVPWDCKEDVPLNAWIREVHHETSRELFVFGVSDMGAFTMEDSCAVEWRFLFAKWEWSTTRKDDDWHRCGKMKPTKEQLDKAIEDLV